jgi:hypothetical protein
MDLNQQINQMYKQASMDKEAMGPLIAKGLQMAGRAATKGVGSMVAKRFGGAAGNIAQAGMSAATKGLFNNPKAKQMAGRAIAGGKKIMADPRVRSIAGKGLANAAKGLGYGLAAGKMTGMMRGGQQQPQTSGALAGMNQQPQGMPQVQPIQRF